MKQINLLPKNEQRELKLMFLVNRLSSFWIWVVASLVVFFALSLITRFYLEKIMTDTQVQIDLKKTELDSADFKDLENQILQLNRNIKEIKNLQSQHYYLSNTLIQLSNIIPDDMQLNQIALDRTTGKIQVAGQAKTRDSVITFWANVIKSDYFKNINFPLANLEKPTDPNFTFTFSVSLDKFKTE